jgi:hypothetical protein
MIKVVKVHLTPQKKPVSSSGCQEDKREAFQNQTITGKSRINSTEA